MRMSKSLPEFAQFIPGEELRFWPVTVKTATEIASSYWQDFASGIVRTKEGRYKLIAFGLDGRDLFEGPLRGTLEEALADAR